MFDNHNIQQTPLILASQSPRRKYLLEQAGLKFEVIPSNIDESSVIMHDPREYVITLSRIKAEDIAYKYPKAWVIGADTIVLISGSVLGKPKDRDAARIMLKRLSGQTHQVYTGYTICCAALSKLFFNVVSTDVIFKKLTNDEIEWYVHTNEPFDKAGAYAIQGLGTFLVKRINGSYTNVVGLPVCEVVEHLVREAVICLKI